MMDNYIKTEYQPSHCIIDQEEKLGSVYLGDINAALNIQDLRLNGINTVITASDGMQHVKYASGINHIRYPLLDSKSQQISRYFQQSYHVIDKARRHGNVLIHCAAGVSRSATLIIAYLMYRNCWPFKKAIEYVRQKRSIVCPNYGFEMQLKEYEKFACKRSSSTKSTIIKPHDYFKKSETKDLKGNLPQIYLKPKNKYLRFRKYSNMTKKPQRQQYLKSKLNLPNNLIIVPFNIQKTPNYPPISRSIMRVKPKSSHILSRYISS